MATGDKVYIADKETLDNVNTNVTTINDTKIGVTTDTDGSETSGTVMGKLNKLITSEEEEIYEPSTSYSGAKTHIDICNASSLTISTENRLYKISENWVAKKDGMIRLYTKAMAGVTITSGTVNPYFQIVVVFNKNPQNTYTEDAATSGTIGSNAGNWIYNETSTTDVADLFYMSGGSYMSLTKSEASPELPPYYFARLSTNSLKPSTISSVYATQSQSTPLIVKKGTMLSVWCCLGHATVGSTSYSSLKLNDFEVEVCYNTVSNAF